MHLSDYNLAFILTNLTFNFVVFSWSRGVGEPRDIKSFRKSYNKARVKHKQFIVVLKFVMQIITFTFTIDLFQHTFVTTPSEFEISGKPTATR